MYIYNFFSAPCGSGKTHQIIDRASEWAGNGRQVIIFMPTKELIDKSIEHFLLTRTNRPFYKIFHGDLVSTSVTRELADHLKHTGKKAQIVFTTHAALPYLPPLHRWGFWHCFVDEAPQVFKHLYCDAHSSGGGSITGLIDIEHHNAIYGRVTIKNRKKAALKRIAKDLNADETYREIAQTLVNKNWQTYVKAQDFEALKTEGKSKVSFFSILMPKVLDKFASATMASANFEGSFVYQLWSQEGVQFREDSNIASRLQYKTHHNGNLITIKYAFERDWSRKLRQSPLDSNSDESETVQSLLIDAVTAEFRDTQ